MLVAMEAATWYVAAADALACGRCAKLPLMPATKKMETRYPANATTAVLYLTRNPGVGSGTGFGWSPFFRCSSTQRLLIGWMQIEARLAVRLDGGCRRGRSRREPRVIGVCLLTRHI